MDEQKTRPEPTVPLRVPTRVVVGVEVGGVTSEGLEVGGEVGRVVMGDYLPPQVNRAPTEPDGGPPGVRGPPPAYTADDCVIAGPRPTMATDDASISRFDPGSDLSRGGVDGGGSGVMGVGVTPTVVSRGTGPTTVPGATSLFPPVVVVSDSPTLVQRSNKSKIDWVGTFFFFSSSHNTSSPVFGRIKAVGLDLDFWMGWETEITL